MSTIFDLVTNALAPYVGGVGAAGFILGSTTIILLFTGFAIMFGKDIFNKQTGLTLFLFGVALVSNPVVNWYPLWVPFLIILGLAFAYWQKYL